MPCVLRRTPCPILHACFYKLVTTCTTHLSRTCSKHQACYSPWTPSKSLSRFNHWHSLSGINDLTPSGWVQWSVSICTRIVCHCVGTCIILIECHLTGNLSLKPRQLFNSCSQMEPTPRLSPFIWQWHVSRTCVASQSLMRDVRMTNDAHSQMWHVYLGQMHSYVWHVSFKCGGVIRSYVWICVRMCATSERSKIQDPSRWMAQCILI